MTLRLLHKQEIIDSVLGQVTRKTKVIAIPHIISVYGTVMPIAELSLIHI